MQKAIPLSVMAVLFCQWIGSAVAQPPTPPPTEIDGTVVSVRGNILHIRPSLRPRLARILVSEKTEIVGNRRTDISFLKPGMRIRCGGPYNEKTGLTVMFTEAAKTPIGQLKIPIHGIQNNGGFAMAGGTLKSVEPFVFVDDDGKEFTADASRMRGVWEDFPMEKTGLLIGTRLFAVGKLAPDGVLQADAISPERDQAANGTMYGEVVQADGEKIIVRPRYTQETITVTRKPDCILLREVRLDPDSFKVGDAVTFWGQYQRSRPDNPLTGEPKLGALALLVGDGRYPASSDPSEGGVFLTGKIASLDPVKLALPDGKSVEIIVPAQMAIARLDKITEKDIKPGTQVMMVLSRGKDDTFEASHIIIDASPWVGYGG